MSVFTPWAILVFSTLILAFLHLVPGVFLLLEHYNTGKYSAQKASRLSLFFILGVETIITLFFLLLFFLIPAILTILPCFDYEIINWSLSGILIALAILFFFCYFRKGAGTQLFISRALAAQYDQKARTIKNRSDAFVLGFSSIIPELIFTLPLYIIVILQLMTAQITIPLQVLFAGTFILAPLIPLFIIHFLRQTHCHLANFMKFRFEHKTFFRCIISLFLFIISHFNYSGVNPMSHPLDEKQIKRELKIDAKALEIPPGSANIFIEKIWKDAQKTLKPRKLITSTDLNRAIVKEAKKYHADLAYVYKNRDKII